MIRHADTEMTVMKEEVSRTHSPLKQRHRIPRCGDPMGKHHGQSRGRGSKGKMWARAFIIVVPLKGKGKAW